METRFRRLELVSVELLPRVVEKSWCQVASKVQPIYRQPTPAMPGWCLTKQALFMPNDVNIEIKGQD